MNSDAYRSDLAHLSISELAANLAAGHISARGLTELYLQRIATHNPALGAFIAVTDGAALAAADASDKRRAEGRSLGPLDGIPIALKDNIDLAGVPTTAGVEARRKSVAQTDATVTARLKAAGAVILGKLNMHEAAHGATTANEAYGFCQNPHRPGFTPGGSSGGSGTAVAAGLCAGALGTDTLGSIRIPASFCGIVGLKPTQGLTSLRGIVPLCFSLDHVGPMTRTVTDAALMLDVLSGLDAADPFSRLAPRTESAFNIPADLRGVRLGRLRDLNAFASDTMHPDVAAAYDAALKILSDRGARIVDVALEGYQHNAIRSKAMLMIEADLAVVYAKELESTPLGFTQLFRDGVAFGQRQSAPKLAAAIDTIRSVKPIAARLFSEVDALVTPTTLCPAFSFQQAMPKTLTAFTALGNYAGAPAVSVPMGLTADALPMGLQIMAGPWHDMTALRIAAVFEKAQTRSLRPQHF